MESPSALRVSVSPLNLVTPHAPTEYYRNLIQYERYGKYLSPVAGFHPSRPIVRKRVITFIQRQRVLGRFLTH